MMNRLPKSREIANLQETVDRFLNESVIGRPLRTIRAVSDLGKTDAPVHLPVDLYTTASELVILAAVPGLGPADIDISWERGKVTLRGTLPDLGQSDEGKSATWVTREVPTGSFERAVALPVEVDADKAAAIVEQGLLMLRMPRTDAGKVRRIAVQGSTGAPSSTHNPGE